MSVADDLVVPWRALGTYCLAMDSAVQAWIAFTQKHLHFEPFERESVEAFLARLRHTFAVLREQYAYDTLHTLSIVPVASGFPERYQLRKLETAYDAPIDTLEASSALMKRVFLDRLFGDNVPNLGLLERVAKAKTRELLHFEPMRMFRVVSLKQVRTHDGAQMYRLCFERFCHRNMPSLYLIEFQLGSSQLLEEGLRQEIEGIVRKETKLLPRLADFARQLTLACAPIDVSWVGRISFGPVFVAHVTKDQHALQTALNAHALQGEYLTASRIICEYVATARRVPSVKLFDPKGRRHRVVHEFAVPQLHDEQHERGVTSVKKYLFAPHRVEQALTPKFREEIGHTFLGEVQ
jgi:hypothetical protein